MQKAGMEAEGIAEKIAFTEDGAATGEVLHQLPLPIK
jgi:hypothetical protein